MKRPAEAIKDFTVLITPNKIDFRPKGVNRQSCYKLDPKADPKVIEVTPLDGPAKGKTLRGLYALDGDRLKLCLQNGNGPAPTAFATKSDSGLRLLTLKREAADKDKEEKPFKASAGVRADDDKMRRLLNDWSDAAKKAFEAHKQEFLVGSISQITLIESSRRLLRAEVERSENKAARIAAYEANLNRIKEIADVEKLRFEAGKLSISDLQDTKAARCEAEFLLEREKAN